MIFKTMVEQEGGREIIIPEQKFITCSGCKFYSQSMIKSGLYPLRNYNCNHPEIKEDLSVFFLDGNLRKNHMNIIETPEWCPYLKNKTNG